MSDFLSVLIATAYAAVASLGAAPSNGSEAESRANKAGVSETRVDARIEFKRAENKANAGYQSAIADCKKMPVAEKHGCLDSARAANDDAIADAKAANEKTVADAVAAAAAPGLQASAGR